MSDDLRQLFTQVDLGQLEQHGLSVDEAVSQLGFLREPTRRFRTLDRAAVIGDGIRRLDRRFVPDLLLAADQARRSGRLSRFVPASGAASRMFRSLLEAFDELERGTAGGAERAETDRFLDALPRLALRHELGRLGIHAEESTPTDDQERSRLLFRILSATEAGFASRAKGLVPFHEYDGEGRTPFEEHLREAAAYSTDDDGRTRVHFTVPDNSREAFERLLGERRGAIEADASCTLEVTFSTQRAATDTISVDSSGAPFRDSEGRLLFRPGGHGALLANLEELSGDIVVVKNIDNVVRQDRMREVAYRKRLLIGYLATLQESVHAYLRAIHEDGTENHWLDHGLQFAARQLSIQVPDEVMKDSREARRDFLVRILDRPIRVCGMVRNEGEPGGGPFWVRDESGRSSLQIVESAEVDREEPEQNSIWESSTHFNPVDLVLGLRDWREEPFALRRYVDPTAVFRAGKSSGGRDLVALERPGLWNGAMADWTTVFIEVPVSTFAPVKTVFDLLRPEHA